MSEWRKFFAICKTKKLGDIAVLVVTFVLAVVLNLVFAIIAGIILTLVFFLLAKLRAKKHTDKE